ncbi:phosphoribosylformylglycinamidine cyclo-ligase [Fructilactobacillus cliffordii]|uniref:Phosphoribosylformylglycinamidine cyclo-ligase n=1 Tax=Fructilactobacillus cliffordii TaxID=2940299 RepID=A0A9Q8ZU21_9LACO|nr:phosphoribosylformylglycinamidine cyclo-ligase [Fructilactobacillus cliffordii]USS89313.1 phosphoribosylformylglycinamidine cyclo-ligase [Fructilactobacillus cliffordii]
MEDAAYRRAGVDIAAGNDAVQRMKADVEATYTPNVLSGLGNFGAVLAVPSGYEQPVLVSGTDGVGTKLLLAIAANQHDTIGQDLVAMVMNDIVTEGAAPLFLEDYLAVDKMRPEVVSEIVKGVAQATKTVGAALIGGESAELPGLYAEHHYDLAAFGVGIVERDQFLNGVRDAQAGDQLIGLPSTGIHSNGYSLVRAVLGIKHPEDFQRLDPELQQTLLAPTKLYYPVVKPLLDQYQVVSMAHITGGGMIENLPRSFAADQLQAQIAWGSWEILPIFNQLQQAGDLTTAEMLTTFNLGIGMIMVVHPEQVETALDTLRATGEQPVVLGELVEKQNASAPSVTFTGGQPWNK